jgi:uncharacterized membrane protein YoaT (DUF817 family)
MKFFIKELYFFTFKQVKSTIFAGSFLILLFISNKINLHILYRYDFLFIGSVLIQFILIKYKLETKDEAKNIILFHLIGLILEIYKTSSFVGSWSYPEPGYLKVLNVPLYSGFYVFCCWKLYSKFMEKFQINSSKQSKI